MVIEYQKDVRILFRNWMNLIIVLERARVLIKFSSSSWIKCGGQYTNTITKDMVIVFVS